MKKTLLKIFIIVIFSSLCGCGLLAVSFESVRQSGLTESSRKGLLQREIAKFSDVIGAFDATKALAFASDSYRESFKEKLLKHKNTIKFIGNEVVLIDYMDNARRAEVTVRTRFYRIPVYVAEEKDETLVWVYEGGGEWKLDDILPTK